MNLSGRVRDEASRSVAAAGSTVGATGPVGRRSFAHPFRIIWRMVTQGGDTGFHLRRGVARGRIARLRVTRDRVVRDRVVRDRGAGHRGAGLRAAIALFVMGCLVAGCVDPTPIEPARAQGARNVLTLLSLLEVEEEAPRQGYQRSLFPHWDDITGSGCTARQDALLAQALRFVQSDVGRRCVVVEGDWYSLYDGVTHSGSPADIDVDHVVALAEAWDSGAHAWDPLTRQQFANDPLHLLVVTRQSNSDKADMDVADWKPDRRDSWCVTASMVILVKLRYELSVDPAERDGLERMVDTCEHGNQRSVPGVPMPGSPEFDAIALAIMEERGLGSGAVLAPELTVIPEITITPEVTDAPEDTDAPEVTDARGGTDVPEDTITPEVTGVSGP